MQTFHFLSHVGLHIASLQNRTIKIVFTNLQGLKITVLICNKVYKILLSRHNGLALNSVKWESILFGTPSCIVISLQYLVQISMAPWFQQYLDGRCQQYLIKLLSLTAIWPSVTTRPPATEDVITRCQLKGTDEVICSRGVASWANWCVWNNPVPQLVMPWTVP